MVDIGVVIDGNRWMKQSIKSLLSALAKGFASQATCQEGVRLGHEEADDMIPKLEGEAHPWKQCRDGGIAGSRNL